ncbi:tyrosine-type recombinase/integrase [Microbacterium sp. ZXX196]|uniref:tyrosine-type recombinase/integrase n=1 Tax=Microbacterium sp. ZXX196 TaxID=2609291 RepID=UPI0018AD0D60|nr:tyrosine-type recombinase/integrase [Microbacterium sp. ZXX196]
MTRGKGEGSIYKASDGLWTVAVELPRYDPTKRRRKVIRSKDKRTAIAKLRKLQSELEATGDLQTAGITVEGWFTYWLANIAAKELRPNTLRGYASTAKNHIVPGLGAGKKLDKITPRDVRTVHDLIIGGGGKSTYALNAHRIMSRAFKIAQREGHLSRNPAELVDAPRADVIDLDVLTLDESLRLLEVCAKRPDGARWATSLLTAARRGEVIGLELDRVGSILDLSWQMQRLKKDEDGGVTVPRGFEYRHVTGGLYWTRPKSKAGWRTFPLVEPLKTILERQAAEPDHPKGLMFSEKGRPRDPDQDTAAWGALLRETFGQERYVRLHDLRHTAVDLLYLAGVPEDLIIEIVGHSTRAMSRAYKSRGNQARLTDALERFSALLTPPGTPAGSAASLPALE